MKPTITANDVNDDYFAIAPPADVYIVLPTADDDTLFLFSFS